MYLYSRSGRPTPSSSECSVSVAMARACGLQAAMVGRMVERSENITGSVHMRTSSR